jgi:hypothetical protein
MPTSKLKIDGVNGVMAIMDYGTNDAAITNPNLYLSQLRFHSGLNYSSIVARASSSSISFSSLARNYVTWDEGSKCDPCCFIMLEARYGNGVMDEVVRRYRDEFVNDRNKRGYYKLAEVLVPLMREYVFVKYLVIYLFANPLVYYGKWHYGHNKWGWVFKPVKNFWMNIFNTLGNDTKFIRENGEVI